MDGTSGMSGMNGARVVVIGASSGVGRSFAHQAIAAGAQVVATARRADRLDELVAEAGAGHVVAADVSDPEDCQRIAEQSLAVLGTVDLVFYAAGHAPLQHLAATTTDQWRAVLETNVIGVQRIIGAFVPHMAESGIVAVLSSEAAGRPRPGLGAYGTSKVALSESLRAWRLEHPEIRFSCVALGATQPTEFGDGFTPEVLIPVLESWFRHGLMQRDYMHTTDVAQLLIDVLGAALRVPGIGLEELVLRSPSPIVDDWA
jgi:NADP-dependent 3-hydroxy acid dehydrogenase YdfG